MQILDVPHTHQIWLLQCLTQGICFLKGSRFKRRHKGAPDYVQHPTTGFITKQQYKAQHPQEYVTKHRRTTQTNSRRNTQSKGIHHRRENSNPQDIGFRQFNARH